MKIEVEMSAVRAAILADPWTAVGIAFAAGACLALVEPRGPLARAIAGTTGAVALAALREALGQRISAKARSWIDDRVPAYARHATT